MFKRTLAVSTLRDVIHNYLIGEQNYRTIIDQLGTNAVSTGEPKWETELAC